jgi:hypothetical protein
VIQRHRGEDEGQVLPALLLAVVAILFFGLLFTQVGSAAEQKTQAQTATDSAAVAGTHQVRDFAFTSTAPTMPWSFAIIFAAVPQIPPRPHAAACSAAQRNWSSNPHGGTAIDCGGSLSAVATGDGVRVDLTAPAGQVVTGPADASDQRAEASAVARVVFARCPLLVVPIHRAIANWILDNSLRTLGVTSSCFTAADETLLDEVEEWSFGTAAAAIGPPGPILDAVRSSTRVELVDD